MVNSLVSQASAATNRVESVFSNRLKDLGVKDAGQAIGLFMAAGAGDPMSAMRAMQDCLGGMGNIFEIPKGSEIGTAMSPGPIAAMEQAKSGVELPSFGSN